jgi:hypothetical protein
MQVCSLVQCRWGNNVAEALKFSRETAFTPETIQILAAALDEAWERLRQSSSRLVRPAYSRAMREVVAKRIMEMAQRGVQDRDALVADALRSRKLRRTWQSEKLTRLSIVAYIAAESYSFVRRQGNRYKVSGEFPQSAGQIEKPQHRHNCDPWASTKLQFSELSH